jgi:hypothetical protein
VEPIWRRSALRAGAAVPMPATTAEPGLAVEVGGRRIRPAWRDGQRYIFALPRDVRMVRLTSRASSPAALRPWHEDRRHLGVKIERILVDGDAIALDGPELRAGWWTPEAGGRWTDGAALLCLPAGAACLEVRVAAADLVYPLGGEAGDVPVAA